MRSTRTRLVIVAAAAFTVVVTTWAADHVVEDWRSYPIGTRGIPGDWKAQNWGQAAYDFEIVADNGQPVLHLKSKGDSSTISRDLRGQFNLRETQRRIVHRTDRLQTASTGVECIGAMERLEPLERLERYFSI